MNFQKWWEESKEGVCHDIKFYLKLDVADPKIEDQLKHIACQAWVASSCNYDDGDNHV